MSRMKMKLKTTAAMLIGIGVYACGCAENHAQNWAQFSAVVQPSQPATAELNHSVSSDVVMDQPVTTANPTLTQ